MDVQNNQLCATVKIDLGTTCQLRLQNIVVCPEICLTMLIANCLGSFRSLP